MDNSQLAPLLIGKLLNIGGMLKSNGNRMLLPFNLNQQQFSIFFEIAKAGKVQQKDMVNRLLLEKAHVSKVIKKLKTMKLITITTLDDDKRSSWLSLTPKGEQTLKECMEILKKWNKKLLGTLLEVIDKKQLITMLDHLTELQNIFKKLTLKIEK